MKQTSKYASPMSNQGRNQYVVTHITDALLELIKTKSLSDISISEICDKAQVGRASFYRNFESKEAVIARHLKTLLDDWFADFIKSGSPNIVEAIFTHYYQHKELCITLYRQGLAYLSLQSIKDACGAKSEQTNFEAYTSAFFAHGLYGWIEEWFRRGMQETPKKMQELWLASRKETVK